MSFLTLFTADAAAAHGREFSPTPLVSQYWKDHTTSPMHRVSSISSIVSTVPEEVFSSPTSLSSVPSSRRPPRTKTKYYLAPPPPGAHYIHRQCARAERALIVQVQKVSNTSRPLPTIDVLPSFVFGSRLRRVGHCLHGAGQQDMVFVTSEKYRRTQDQQDEDLSDDDEDLNSRRVIASTSQAYRRGSGDEGKGIRTTVIRFNGGHVWEVSPLTSGGYEFAIHELDGTMGVAKWLPRPANFRRRSYQSYQQRINPEAEDRKFQFSMLDNATRRRPIIAWMSQHSIEILNRHPGNVITSNTNTPSNTPPASIMDVDISAGDGHQQYSEVSEELRSFIAVTGTWVALQEGFASNPYRIDGTPLPPTSVTFRAGATRSISSGNSTISEESTDRRSHPQRAAELPRRVKSMGSTTSSLVPQNMNRVSRPFGRSSAPNKPEPALEQQPDPSVRLVPHIRPISVPPPEIPPEQNISRSFPGRHRRANSGTYNRQPKEFVVGVSPARSGSPVEPVNGREKRSRFGLRAMMSNIFKRSSAA